MSVKLVVALVAFVAISAAAQEVGVKGTIKDKQGKSIENALVRFEKLGLVTVTSPGGGFVLSSTSPVLQRDARREKIDGITIARGAAIFSIASNERIEFSAYSLQGRLCIRKDITGLLPGTYSASLKNLLPATLGSGSYVVSVNIGGNRSVAGRIIHRAGMRTSFDVKRQEEHAGIHLARQAGMVDIVTISKLGYVEYSTPIESYQQNLGDIVLEKSGALDGVAAITAVEDSLVNILVERIQSIEDLEGPDELKTIDFISIRNGFEAILAIDSTRMKSNIGYMTSALASLNVNPKIWKIADSLDAYIDAQNLQTSPVVSGGAPKRLMKQAMKKGGVLTFGKVMAAETPAMLLASVQKPSFPKFLTISYLQDLIEADLLPVLAAVQRSAGRVEALPNASMVLTVDGDEYEIDKGEVFAVDAYTRLMQGYLYMLCAYDMDLYAAPARQDYSWIDTIVNSENDSKTVYTLKSDTLYKIQSWNGEKKMYQTMANMFHYNLEQRPSFMTIRRPFHAASLECFKSVPAKIKSGLAAIRAETDDQENDLLQISLIDEANGEMLDFSGELREEGFSASFAENFSSLDKMMDFINTVLGGPYTFDETIEAKKVAVTINLPAWFNNPVTDLRTLLPNYTWTNEAKWVTANVDNYASGYWGTEQTCINTGGVSSTTCQKRYYINVYENETVELKFAQSLIDSVVTTTWGDKKYYINRPITQQVSIDSSYFIDPLRLTDESGAVIENETVDQLIDNKMFFPYFKDYTFHGLFPGMTRAKWLDLIWSE